MKCIDASYMMNLCLSKIHQISDKTIHKHTPLLHSGQHSYLKITMMITTMVTIAITITITIMIMVMITIIIYNNFDCNDIISNKLDHILCDICHDIFSNTVVFANAYQPKMPICLQIANMILHITEICSIC